jgi:hypothetical protein
VREELLIVAGVVAALIALRFSLRRSATVLLARVANGKLTVVRGAIAPRVLGDLRDVVKAPPIARATLRIVKSEGLARLDIDGDVSAAQAQQLRNVIGALPLSALMNARRRA